MKRSLVFISIVASAVLSGPGRAPAAAPAGTAFTYQGQLKEGGVPVPGPTCDFDFSLWDDPANTNVSHRLGTDLQVGVDVANGLFTALLDFGNVFDGDARWLQIRTRCPSGAGSYTLLIPRQELTPGPYALFATKGGDGGGGGFWSESGNDIYNNNSGNVGIGTIPSGPLDVLGSLSTGSVATVTNDVASGISGSALTVISSGRRSIGNSGMIVNNLVTKVGGSNSTKTGLEVNSTGSWAPGTTNQPNVGLHVTASGADRNYPAIFEGGNVGIGTRAPDSALHVKAPGAEVHVEDTGSATAQVYLGEGGDSGINMVYSSVDDNLSFVPRIQGVDQSVALSIMRATGNVGIGTDDPSEELTVESGTSTTSIDINNTGTGDPRVRFQLGGISKFTIGVDNSDGDKFKIGTTSVANSPRLTIDSSGNVGIGTTSPSSKLHVEGDASGSVIATIHNKNNTGSERLHFGTSSGSDAGMIVWGSTNASSPGKWRFFNNKTSANYDWVTSGGIKMTLANNGRLGIGAGTGAPGAMLHVAGSTRPVVLAETSSASASAYAVEGVVQATAPGGYSAGVRGMNNSTTGNGIGVYGTQNGSGWGVYGQTPSGRGVYGNSTTGTGVYGVSTSAHGVWARSGGGGIAGAALLAESTNTTNGIALNARNNSSDATVVIGNSGTGYLFKAFSPLQPCCAIVAIKNDGTMMVPVLEITGGLDLAERFPVSDRVEPGMVVEIDPHHAGKLRLAQGTYNRRVTGVASGANGLPAGAILGNPDADGDSPPIALSGRVWVYSDASEQPIELGDLLTTSGTPGHAMKVTDYSKAQGAILGKAMTSLKTGKGLVLVLVTLQ